MRLMEKVKAMKKLSVILLQCGLSIWACGCVMKTIPLDNITGDGEQRWVWPYFLDDRPTVVAFWNTNEMQCLRDVPALQALDAREGQVELVTAVTGRDRPEIIKWIRREHIEYPVLLDIDGALSRHLDVDWCPAYLLFDSNGKEIGRTPDVRDVRLWFDDPQWLGLSGAVRRPPPFSRDEMPPSRNDTAAPRMIQ